MYVIYLDNYSGGGKSTDYERIIIEAVDEDEADKIFEKKFNYDPYSVSCECCGDDYSITWADTEEELNEYLKEYPQENQIIIRNNREC